ncbi:uncharacterized protein LOC111073031 [Drosophila obscura]|uniref:uncharacterized protein LOC111073031 n=1 Tax=Drosophila obscura TaxID=7282 RepID=UPI000BA08099|nr:uncharacterized protein LOC111073031 [Drosophila obscura]
MEPVRSLLPHILDLLSRQPTLSADVEDLCTALEPIVVAQHIRPFGTLKKAVEFAMQVGINLGILSLREESRRLPFSFRRTNAVDKRPLTPMLCKGRPARKAVKKTRTKSRAKAKAKATKAKAKAKPPRVAHYSSGSRQCRKPKAQPKRRR